MTLGLWPQILLTGIETLAGEVCREMEMEEGYRFCFRHDELKEIVRHSRKIGFRVHSSG